VDCYYFVAAEALSTTFSTIYLVYPQTVVPLLRNKFFSDFIAKKDEQTLAAYNSVEKTQLKITVHSGELEITARFKNSYKSSQSFKAQQSKQFMTVDVSESAKVEDTTTAPKDVDPYFSTMKNKGKAPQERIPVNFIFQALSDATSYTIEVKSLAEKGQVSGFAQYENINPGEPNHVEITNSQILCIDGHLRDFDEEILITTNSDNK
jgi:hypothetical protein